MSSFVAIEPLQSHSLSGTLALLQQVFPWQPLLERADFALRLSLMTGVLPKVILRLVQVRSMRYWVAWDADHAKVLGVTGLYQRNDSTYWLGWTGVNPALRRQGIGSQLVDHAIDVVKKLGASQLWVWTKGDWSCRFYLKRGFVVRQAQAEVIVLEKQL